MGWLGAASKQSFLFDHALIILLNRIINSNAYIKTFVYEKTQHDISIIWADGAEYADLYLNDDFETEKESESTVDWQRIMLIAVSLLILTAMLVAIFEGFTYLAIFLVVGGGGAYYLLKKKEKSTEGKHDQNYKALLTSARGDAALVDRWIAYERSRNPDAGEEQLMEAALYRWERDNR